MAEEIDHDDLAGKVSGEAYQIIGTLAEEAGLFGHPAVTRALNYFGREQWRETGAEILPWQIPSPDTGASNG